MREVLRLWVSTCSFQRQTVVTKSCGIYGSLYECGMLSLSRAPPLFLQFLMDGFYHFLTVHASDAEVFSMED